MNQTGPSRGRRPSSGPRSSSRGGRGDRSSHSSAYEMGMQFAQSGSFSRPAHAARPSRPSFGGGSRGGSYGGGSRGGSRGRGRGPADQSIDVSRFINKAEAPADIVAYVPTHSFADFPIDEHLKENIIKKGYTTPTPIQDQSIPHALKGSDIVGIANTGTGKTAAFLIPLIDKVLKLRALGQSERVLIMVPTRELAIQIESEFFGFAKGLGLTSVTCVGGANIVPQMRVLRRDPSFVIGTPGRLKDLMERRELTLSGFGTVVLDEADRMLDMGFISDMRFIMGQMKGDRHTLFFSATLSREIENLIGEFLNNPVRVSVKTRETSATIDQDVVRVSSSEKFSKLVELLSDKVAFDKVLVFGRTKHGVERLSKELRQAGIRAESIHGDKTHGARQKALSLFKASHAQVLVATDVAARGLDISGVSHVINYDLPASYEDYTHRIGRTGRAGQVGKALTFIS